jgi:hypothetical protein
VTRDYLKAALRASGKLLLAGSSARLLWPGSSARLS